MKRELETATNSGGVQQAGNGFSEAAYWGSTINTLYGINAEKNLAANTSRANAYKNVTGRVPKSLRTATSYSKHVTTVAKTASRGLFVVGTAMTVYDMATDPTPENLAWGSADLIMGGVSLVFPVAGLIYFTGRMVYEIATEE